MGRGREIKGGGDETREGRRNRKGRGEEEKWNGKGGEK